METNDNINNIYVTDGGSFSDPTDPHLPDPITQPMPELIPTNQTLIFNAVPTDNLVTDSVLVSNVTSMPVQQQPVVQTPAPIVIHPGAATTNVNVVVSPAKKKTTRATKKKKDPNAPSAACSAYTLFFRDKQATVKEHNPGAKFGDISRIVASLWEALGENEKAVYRQRNAEDKKRYQQEMEAYNAGQYLGKQNQQQAHATTHELFKSSDPSFRVVGSEQIVIKPEDITNNECIREGCAAAAIKSAEWEDEYCSNDCAVQHCKNIFQAFVNGAA